MPKATDMLQQLQASSLPDEMKARIVETIQAKVSSPDDMTPPEKCKRKLLHVQLLHCPRLGDLPGNSKLGLEDAHLCQTSEFVGFDKPNRAYIGDGFGHLAAEQPQRECC